MSAVSESKPNVALVLSGGGAMGAAHVGVLRHLLPTFEVDYLIGTSAGAIIAAAVACGLKPDEISIYLGQKRLFAAAFDLSWGGSGIIRGKKVLEILRAVYQDRHFSDLPDNLKLRVCATDFATGELVVLKSGSIADAVRASLAVPGLFKPHWIAGRPLVDGGLVANLPIAPALEEYRGEKIIAVDVCSAPPLPILEDPDRFETNFSWRAAIERSLRIFFLNQTKELLRNSRVSVITPDLVGFKAIDVTKLRAIENLGAEAWQSWQSLEQVPQ